MTSDIANLRQRLGAESPPIEYFIDAGSIKYFADSLMDPDPRYAPSHYGSTGSSTGLTAPATFFGSALGLKDISAGDPRTMSALDLPLPVGWARLATGDEFELHAPVTAGMTLIARERLIDVRAKQGRSGRLIFYSIEKTFTSAGGLPVVRRVLHCAAREPVPLPQGHGAGQHESKSDRQAVSLPSLTVGPVTVRYLAMFATATAEFVDIHYDADYARALGLPGPIVQGLYKTALIARMLKDWVGDGTLVRNLSVQHRGMDLAGSVLTAGGAIMDTPTAASSTNVDCHVWVKNQSGAITTYGTARVTRPT